MEKNNIDHLREIIKEFENIDSEKGLEALEFLDAIENEISLDKLLIKTLKDENELLRLGEEVEYDNSDFVGLDTIQWKLDNGNLKIQQQVESFIRVLQRQNAVIPA